MTSSGQVTTKLYLDGSYTDKISTECNPFDKHDYTKGIKFVMGGDIQASRSVTLSALDFNLDNLRFYTRILSATEVKQIYNEEKKEK